MTEFHEAGDDMAVPLCALRAALMGATLSAADHAAAGAFLDALAELAMFDADFVQRIASITERMALHRPRDGG